VVVVLLAAALCAEEETVVARDEIVERLDAGMVLSGQMQRRPKALREKILSRLREELPASAEEVLPESVAGGAEGDVERILARKHVVSYAHREYNSALLKKRLVDTAYQIALSARVEPPTDQERATLADNISHAVKGAKSIIQKYAGNLVEPGAVDAKLAEVEKTLLARIDDRTSPGLKKAVTRERIDQAIKEVDALVAANISKVDAQLARLAAQIPAEQLARFKRRAAAGALNVLAQKAAAALSEMTVDPALAGINPDELVPGYSGVQEQVKQVEAKLFSRKTRPKR